MGDLAEKVMSMSCHKRYDKAGNICITHNDIGILRINPCGDFDDIIWFRLNEYLGKPDAGLYMKEFERVVCELVSDPVYLCEKGDEIYLVIPWCKSVRKVSKEFWNGIRVYHGRPTPLDGDTHGLAMTGRTVSGFRKKLGIHEVYKTEW